MLVPEAGDTIQVMKAGLLEIAHVFVVNKADREGALRMKAELEQMLQLRPGAGWNVPVVLTEAHRDQGVDELLAAIRAHRAHVATDHDAQRAAAEHRVREFFEVINGALAGRVEAGVDAAYAPLLDRVRGGAQDPYSAALEVLGDREGLRRLLDGSG